ncbi:hypothetical protein [Verrucomicrobium sp. BvORR106]|uniref:hypothetical protein n=1 Tax=Verrucomicrobium sp. BvORR106 TaxID=1403819 RepID=UPI00056FABA7|nr:hypothetical protein [Verrucomicrobium sp. BvORR106]
MKRSSQPASGQRRGAALIMTIIVLSLITVMVLGFADLVRNETITSSSHKDRGRAQFFATMGVDMVQGILQKETADPARSWASKPGALIVPADTVADPAADPTKLVRQVDLHSGHPSSTPPTLPMLAPANLNIETLSDQNPRTHLITDQAADPANPTAGTVKLGLKWVYVRQNGGLDDAESPVLNNKTNPLVGRFAYWADDESSKINLNTAWKRNPIGGSQPPTTAKNSFSPSHPTSVNLAALNGFTPEMADQLHAAITPGHSYMDMDTSGETNRFFNSTFEARVLGPGFVTALNASKFETTHYNHDPDTTFFNEPRIVLTTQKKHSRGRPFLDILKNPGTDTTLGDDPGYIRKKASPYNTATSAETIDRTKLDNVLQKLIGYLERTDWPMTSGKRSLQDKYFAGNKTRLAQLALGIIEYVRCAESDKPFVEPIRLFYVNGKYELVTTGNYTGNDDTFKGNARGLHITEMAVWRSMTATNSRYKVRYYIEVHLPKDYGFDSVNLLEPEPGRKLFLYQTLADGFYASANATQTAAVDNGTVAVPQRWFKVAMDGSTVVPTTILENGAPGNPVMQPGEYRTIVMEFYRASTSTIFGMRHGLAVADTSANANNAVRLDLTPVPDFAPKGITLNYTAATNVPDMGINTIPPQLKSMETDDPRVNGVKQDWQMRTSGHTFGARNSRYNVGKAPTVANSEPEQDTDKAGNISDASLRLPYPRGHARNPSGVVYSPGELGFVSTGLEGKSRDAGGGEAVKGGTPWRSLRLQPNRYNNTDEVPDWAFMDLFTVPVDVPTQAKSMFAPHNSSTSGRVNMNAQAQPFGNPALVSSPLERRLPLVALLAGVPYPTPTDPNAILTTAKAQDIASNIYFRTLADASNFKGKTYGKADTYDSPGEVVEIKGVADEGEESEAVVRGIANLITSRGGVFTIYTIGQALNESRNGTLRITAEQRQQVMLERYTSGGQVHFRKVASQLLTP